MPNVIMWRHLDIDETKRIVGKKFDIRVNSEGHCQKPEHIKNHMNIAAFEAASHDLHSCNHYVSKSYTNATRNCNKSVFFIASTSCNLHYSVLGYASNCLALVTAITSCKFKFT